MIEQTRDAAAAAAAAPRSDAPEPSTVGRSSRVAETTSSPEPWTPVVQLGGGQGRGAKSRRQPGSSPSPAESEAVPAASDPAVQLRILEGAQQVLLGNEPLEVPDPYGTALTRLAMAMDREAGAPSERLAMLDEGYGLLLEVLEAYSATGPDQAAWCQRYVQLPYDRIRAGLHFEVADTRMRGATDAPRPYEMLRDVVPGAVQAWRLVEDTLVAIAETSDATAVASLRAKADEVFGPLGSTLRFLESACSVLPLAEPDISKQLGTAKGLEHVLGVADFFKRCMDGVAGVTVGCLLFAAGVAKVAGDASYVEEALKMASKISGSTATALTYLGGALDVATGVYQLAVATSPRARAEATATIGGGIASIIAGGVIGGGAGGVIGLGASVYLKGAVFLYFGGGDMAGGVTTFWIQGAFQSLQQHGLALMEPLARYSRAVELAALERDPSQREALEKIASGAADTAFMATLQFFADGPMSDSWAWAGEAKKWGRFETLVKRFRHLQRPSREDPPQVKIERAAAVFDALVAVFEQEASPILRDAVKQSERRYGPGID